MTRYPTARIGDFCRTGSGSTPSRSQLERYYEGGAIPWVKSGELREGIVVRTEEHITEAALKETSVKLVPSGAILLAMYGATVGRLAILGVEATTNQAVCHIVPDATAAETRYLYRAIESQVPAIIAMGVGGAQPNISQALVKDLKVPLPPLPEQRRIAAILDQADALRAKRREALAQLDSLTKSTFIEMFGDPTRAGSIGSEVTEPRLLGSLARIRTGKLDANAADEDGAYPFFTCAVKSLRINTAAFDCKATLVAGNGDLNVKYYEGKFNAYQRTYVIESLNESLLVPRFLFAFLDLYVAELRKQAIGGVIKYIKLPYLANALIQVPDTAVQSKFEQRMLQVERIKAAHVRAANETEALFASLQHRAFAGQLS